MSEFLSQLFTDLTTSDSIIVLMFLFGSFLIGLFTGRSAANRKLKQVQKDLKAQEGELLSVRAERDTLSQQTTQQKTEITKLTNALQEAKDQLGRVQQKRDHFQREWQDSQGQVKTLETSVQNNQEQVRLLQEELQKSQDFSQRIQAQSEQQEEETIRLQSSVAQLQEQNHNLQTENTQLQQAAEQQALQIQTLASTPPDISSDRIKTIEEKMSNLEAENDQLRQTISAFNRPSNGTSDPQSLDLASIHKRLTQLEKENQELQSAMMEIQDGEEDIEIDLADDIIFLEEGEEVDEEIEVVLEDDIFNDEEATTVEYNFISIKEKSDSAKVKLKKLYGNKIPKANATQKDNLQLINGIGPFIEEQLNKVGIFTFEQISSFDSEIIELITDAIQFFPGRIKRDNWQGQAAGQLVK